MSQRDYFKSIGDNYNYRRRRNKCASFIRSAKVEFYQFIIKSGKKDCSVLWKYLRDLVPKESKINSLSIQDGKSVLNPPQVANIFNDYFISVACTVPTIENTKPGNLQHLQSFLSALLSHNDKYTTPDIHVWYVESYLKSSLTKKGVNLDGICLRLLKSAASIIAQSLTKILDLSISCGIFPMQ